MAKHKQDEYDEAEIRDEQAQQSLPDEAAQGAEEKPKTVVVEFDLGVWQMHDVVSKLESSFNGQGMRYLETQS